MCVLSTRLYIGTTQCNPLHFAILSSGGFIGSRFEFVSVSNVQNHCPFTDANNSSWDASRAPYIIQRILLENLLSAIDVDQLSAPIRSSSSSSSCELLHFVTSWYSWPSGRCEIISVSNLQHCCIPGSSGSYDIVSISIGPIGSSSSSIVSSPSATIVLSPAESEDRELPFCNIVVFLAGAAAVSWACPFCNNVLFHYIGIVILTNRSQFSCDVHHCKSDSEAAQPASISVPFELSFMVMFVIEPGKRQWKRQKNKSSVRNRRSDSASERDRGTRHERRVADGLANSSTKADITLPAGGFK